MTDVEHWVDANDQYLAVALGWLRERLEQLGGAEQLLGPIVKTVPQTVELVASQDKQRSFWERLVKAEDPIASPPALPPPKDTVSNSKASASPRKAVPLPSAMVEAQAAEHPPALILLAQRLGLSEFERHTLLLCAAMELDTRIAGSVRPRAGRSESALSDLCAGADACSTIRPGTRCRRSGRCATGGWSRSTSRARSR